MATQPACRWAGRARANKEKGSFVLFFSKSCVGERLYSTKHRLLLSNQTARISIQKRKHVQSAITEEKKETLRSSKRNAHLTWTNRGLATSSKYNEKISKPLSQKEEALNGYDQETRLLTRLLKRPPKDGSSSVLSEIEFALLGTNRIARRSILERSLALSPSLRPLGSEQVTKRPQMSPEQKLLRKWGLPEVINDEYAHDRRSNQSREEALEPKESSEFELANIEFYRDIIHSVETRMLRALPMPPSLLKSGMEASAFMRSVGKLLLYAKRLERANAAYVAPTLAIIAKWISSAHFSPDDMRRPQLLSFLTGYTLGLPRESEKPHEPSVWSVVIDRGELLSTTNYLDCIRFLGGVRPIIHIWELMKGTTIMTVDGGTAMRRKITETIIRQLLLSKTAAPQAAWAIAEPLLLENFELQKSTIELLLDWPEHIGSDVRIPGYMVPYFGRKVETYAARIENGLGVVWDSHAKVHKPTNEDVAELLNGEVYSTSELSDQDSEVTVRAGPRRTTR